ncbi:MAG: VOC family protein [Planctomycetota bacterium]
MRFAFMFWAAAAAGLAFAGGSVLRSGSASEVEPTPRPAGEFAQLAAADALASLRVDHVMVHAADYAVSLAWYRDKLGFRPVVEWTVDGLDGTALSYLERNGFLIELVGAPASEQTAALPRPADFAEHFAQRGFTHLCFRVDDVDAALATMNRRGVPTFSEAIDFPALGVRVGFVQDPDGNVIEFKGPMAGNNVLGGKAIWHDLQAAPAGG